jgi:hypothetical protein
VDDTLVEVVGTFAFAIGKHGMIEVVMGGFGGRGRSQFQGLVEYVGQIESTRGCPGFARASLRGLCWTDVATAGGGGGAIEGFIAGASV